MSVSQVNFSLPAELVEHMKWAATHRTPMLEVKPVPMLPIVVQSDFFIYEYRPGAVLKVVTIPRVGNLIAVA